MRKIGAIKSENMQDVLVYRYVVGLGWNEVAKVMHYSTDHVYKLHGWALQAYENVKQKDKDNSK